MFRPLGVAVATALVLTALVSPAFALADQATAAVASPSMAVRVGFEGVVRPGYWAPIEVNLANDGPNVDGQVEVSFKTSGLTFGFQAAPTTYTVPLSLPTQSRKQVAVNVLVPPNVQGNKATVAFVAGGKTVVTSDQTYQPLNSQAITCGVLSQSLGAFNFLSTMTLPSRQQPISIVHLTVDQLPVEANALATLDCLIVGDVTLAKLSPTQQQTLIAWVSSGGLLVVTGGPSWQQSVPYVPAELMPVAVKGLQVNTSIASLEGLSHTTNAGPGPWVAATGPVTSGVAIAGPETAPILSADRFGSGHVVYLAMDAEQEPMRSWAGTVPLWQYILSYTTDVQTINPFSQDVQRWGRQPVTALTASPDLNPKGPWWWVVFGTTYFLVIAVASVVLGSSDRRSWLIGILLLGSVGGTVLATRMAIAQRGGDVGITQVTYIRASAGASVGQAHAYAGIFSPNDRTVDVSTPPGALVSARHLGSIGRIVNTTQSKTLSVQEQGAVSLPELPIDNSGITLVTLDAQTDVGTGIAGTLMSDGQYVRGQVQNKTGLSLNDAALVIGGNVYALGSFNANSVKSVEVPIANPPLDQSSLVPNKSISVADQLYRLLPNHSAAPNDPYNDVLQRVYATSDQPTDMVLGGPYIVGWVDTSPVGISITGASTVTRQFTVLAIGVPLAFTAQSDTVPASLLSRRTLIQAGGASVLQGGFSVPQGGTLGLEYQVPARTPGSFHQITLNVVGGFDTTVLSSPGTPMATVSFFNWSAGNWSNVPVLFGSNVFRAADPYVSPTGEIRMRLNYQPLASGSEALVVQSFSLSLQRGDG